MDTGDTSGSSPTRPRKVSTDAATAGAAVRERPLTSADAAIFVISWTGQHEVARSIQRDLLREYPRTWVIYSDRDEHLVVDDLQWLRVPDSWFFTGKFEKAIRGDDAEVFVFITADVAHRDWCEVARRCLDVFSRESKLGVWSPSIDHSPFSISRFSLGVTEGPGLHRVFQVDSIVWALSRAVIDRLRQFDYSQNVLGWGICGAACMFCHASGRRVVIDEAIEVFHPRGSGYDRHDAEMQMNVFLRQLSPEENRIRQAFYATLSAKENGGGLGPSVKSWWLRTQQRLLDRRRR